MIKYPNKDARYCMELASEFHDMQSKNKVFIDYLTKTIQALDRKNRTEIDEVALRQQQGACQALGDLLGMILSARIEFVTFKKLAEKGVTGGS
jgi:hypothetical protein